MNADVKEHLERLKNSPITNEDYYTDISNLCNAIDTISIDITELVCDTEEALKEKNIKNHSLDWIRERCFQIGTISRVIGEKTGQNKYIDFINLIYFYNKSIK